MKYELGSAGSQRNIKIIPLEINQSIYQNPPETSTLTPDPAEANRKSPLTISNNWGLFESQLKGRTDNLHIITKPASSSASQLYIYTQLPIKIIPNRFGHVVQESKFASMFVGTGISSIYRFRKLGTDRICGGPITRWYPHTPVRPGLFH